MKFVKTPLEGSYLIELEPYVDNRGFFARTFCAREFSRIGFNRQIVQINHSQTKEKGSVRGMHYQTAPACETKIIRCIRGKVFDVIVDIRDGSPTFMKWHGVQLSEKDMTLVYIPEGFAHGFQTLTDDVQLIYFHSEFYSPEYENGLMFNDPALAIDWPLPVTTVSERDGKYPIIDHSFKGIVV